MTSLREACSAVEQYFHDRHAKPSEDRLTAEPRNGDANASDELRCLVGNKDGEKDLVAVPQRIYTEYVESDRDGTLSYDEGTHRKAMIIPVRSIIVKVIVIGRKRTQWVHLRGTGKYCCH